jgi:hypothetical protein
MAPTLSKKKSSPALLKILEKVISNKLIYFLDKYNMVLNLSLDLGKINPQKILLPQLSKT